MAKHHYPRSEDIERVVKQQPTDSKYVTSSYANLVFHTLGSTPEVEEIFSRHGITREQFENSSGSVKLEPMAEAVFEILEVLNIPDAGLSLGSKLHISTHGPVGMAMISAETVGQAIRDASNYYQTSITFCDL